MDSRPQGHDATSTPRYLMMAMPPVPVSDHIDAAIGRLHLGKRLTSLLAPRANRHQSLSDRYWPQAIPDVEHRMRRAGATLKAHAVTMTWNWIVNSPGYSALKPRGMPLGFADLLSAVGAALEGQGLTVPVLGPTPHITLSY